MNKRVMIVEDEKPMIKALTIKLKSEGFEVENAVDADEFFEKIKNGNFDLILLDLMLPKVSGFEILEKLRQDNNKIPVVVASNLSQEEDKKRSKDLGAVDYIVKSESSLVEMVEKIKSLLN
jgi:DNA-binding response OmpR family regulator